MVPGVEPTLGMISAITSGIMAPEIDDLPAICPTGDCDWPIIHSLAVCGGCQTIAPQQTDKYKNETTKLGGPYDSINEVQYTEPLLDTPFDKPGVHYTNYKTYPYLARFRIVKMRFNETGRPHAIVWLPPTGQECGLWFCAKAYDISVRQGVQTKRVVATSESALNNTEPRDFWTKKSENWILPISSLQLHKEPGSMDYLSAPLVVVNALHQHMIEAFNGTYAMKRTWEGEFYESTATSHVMVAIGRYSAPVVVENLAKSMTNLIRTQPAWTAINTNLIDGELNLISPTNRTGAETFVRMINGSTIFLPSASYKATSDTHVNGTAYSSNPSSTSAGHG
jgi:hypothetical protein